jgi:putative RecB family exonuclease
MTVYSHSRLSCFEQCPAKFKFQYVEKIETREEESVEAFLGSRVHETLEKLYRDLLHQKEDSLEELLVFLDGAWEKNWSDAVIVVSKEYGPANYLKMARKYVSDYYQRYHPFDQGRTVALEEQVRIRLDDAGVYKLQGFIDRLSEAKDGFYEIHDYKTNSRLPLVEYLQGDRQLALYMIGVEDSYPDVRDVRLVWHFLKFDKEVRLSRSDEELIVLKQETIRLIDTIEAETVYPARPGGLCEWCEYQSCCGQWAHLFTVREKPANEYMKDAGVVLVNRYAELKSKQKLFNNDVDSELAKLEEALVAFAEKEQVECVFGTKNKVRITESERYVFPAKDSTERRQLEDLIKRMGVWAEVDQLDTSALGRLIQEKRCTKEFLDVVKKYVELEKKKRLWLSKMKE